MGFQSTVNIFNAAGFPGELAFDGPIRSAPYNLNSSGQAQTVGFAFTTASGANIDPAGDSPNAGTAQVGGTGVFAGILVNPKEYASVGTSSDPLGATLNLPDNSLGTLLDMGEIWVELPGPANIGDSVYWDNTSGALGSQGPVAGTATQSTTNLTVATSTGGFIGVGSRLTIVGGVPVTILSQTSGTIGGAGVYVVDQSQTVTPAAAIAGNSVAPAGKTIVPHCVVQRFQVAAVSPTGLAVIRLTN